MPKTKPSFQFKFHGFKADHTVEVTVNANSETEANEKLGKLIDLKAYQTILRSIEEQ